MLGYIDSMMWFSMTSVGSNIQLLSETTTEVRVRDHYWNIRERWLGSDRQKG